MAEIPEKLDDEQEEEQMSAKQFLLKTAAKSLDSAFAGVLCICTVANVTYALHAAMQQSECICCSTVCSC